MGAFKHNRVDIYIRERNGRREIRIPWLPDNIKYESGDTVVASYDIMGKGEINIPNGRKLATISWEGTFPGPNRKGGYMMRGTRKDPSYYHKILESWREKGTSLNVLVTGYPINKDVYLGSYTATPTGGFGDMDYEIQLVEERSIAITKIKKSSNKTTQSTTKRASSTTTAYTIKKGDTLWGISSRFLGAGSKWRTIYNANKSIIESTAKKRGYRSSNNGWWIFPGVKIQIPKK